MSLGLGAISESAISALPDSGDSILETVTESIAIAASVDSAWISTVLEALAMAAVPTTTAHVGNTVTAALAAEDVISVRWLQQVVDAIAIVGNPTGMLIAGVAAAEVLLVTGAATSYQRALAEVAAAFAVADLAERVQEVTVEDAAALLAETQSILAALSTVTEVAAVTAAATGTMLCTAVVAETVHAAATVTTTAHLFALVEDGATVRARINVAGDTFSGFVVDSKTKAVSTYDPYPFNSMCRFGNRYFGAHEGGLVELAGDTDDGAPISAAVRTGLLAVGGARAIRLEAAYLALRTDGEMFVKVVATNQQTGAKDEWWYRVEDRSAETFRRTRAKFGRGLESLFWQFELCNIDGADFKLSEFRLLPMVLDRSMK